MRHHIILRAGIFATLAMALALSAGSATIAVAQEAAGSSEPPPARELPIKHPAGTKLTEQETRGAGIFIQHCALCHLDKTFGAGGSKYCCIKPLGPRLQGMFKDINADEEKAMRDFILNGGPTYMPAFKYGLTPKEIDDIIAYLKTLE
jgi:mono/diheme cytochrome c family protein